MFLGYRGKQDTLHINVLSKLHKYFSGGVMMLIIYFLTFSERKMCRTIIPDLRRYLNWRYQVGVFEVLLNHAQMEKYRQSR